jgi:hypothetical protein
LTVLGNVLLVVAFSGVMTIMAILAALIMAKLIKIDMENSDDWTPAFYDIDNDFVELNGEKILYNEEDQE